MEAIRKLPTRVPVRNQGYYSPTETKAGRSRLGRKNNGVPMASGDLKISQYTGARLDTDVYLQLCDLGEIFGL